jgi:hypothetical protein
MLNRLCLFAALVLTPAVGCSNWDERDASFRLGGTLPTAPSRPEILVREPPDRIVVKYRKKFECAVDLILREGEPLPALLEVALARRKAVRPVGFLEPSKRKGDVYSFRGKVRVFRPVGDYQLRINAVYYVARTERSADGTNLSDRVVFSTDSGPTVQVRP